MGLVAQILRQEIEKHLPLLATPATYLLAYAVWDSHIPPRKINILKHRLKHNFEVLSVDQELFSCSMQSEISLA